MRIVKAALAATVAATALLAVGAPANAQSSAASPSPYEQQIQDLLKRPGAERIDANTVRLTEGATVTFPAQNQSAGGASTNASAPRTSDWFGCAVGNLCMWADAEMSGARLDLWRCGTYSLFNYGFPDRMSSYSNNQTGYVISRFYDGGAEILNEGATGYRRNLYYDWAIDGSGRVDNRIDAVKVC
ncbi:hypothetical protein [Streptomyces sp. ISL-21]|uniref:hypothetical protein n=1 Tax=Streptomyces sp. ISL-21 TaxID=2819179 RepID=UPI001BE63F04|nr:hypothetical protein [Streptomyces sp. ISL-21]MBT2404888.1 hypothetical protein [Streptomyces sp. ISL-21]